MYILYVLKNGSWQAYARFVDRRNYGERVAQVSAIKMANAKTDAEKNAATLLQAFVLGKEYYKACYAKVVMRTLRHFDEVGLSNDIFDELDNLLKEDFEAFALAKDTEDISTYSQGEIHVNI